jgi:hypothetical protein
VPDFRFSLGRISDCCRIEATLKMVLFVSTRGYMSIVAVALSMSTVHGLHMMYFSDDVPDFPDVDVAPYCDVSQLHEALTETQKKFVIDFANALQFTPFTCMEAMEEQWRDKYPEDFTGVFGAVLLMFVFDLFHGVPHLYLFNNPRVALFEKLIDAGADVRALPCEEGSTFAHLIVENARANVPDPEGEPDLEYVTHMFGFLLPVLLAHDSNIYSLTDRNGRTLDQLVSDFKQVAEPLYSDRFWFADTESHLRQTFDDSCQYIQDGFRQTIRRAKAIQSIVDSAKSNPGSAQHQWQHLLAEARKGAGSPCKLSLPDDVVDKIGQFVYGQSIKTKDVRRNLRYFSRMVRRRSDLEH